MCNINGVEVPLLLPSRPKTKFEIVIQNVSKWISSVSEEGIGFFLSLMLFTISVIFAQTGHNLYNEYASLSVWPIGMYLITVIF
jgi:hypothetical protein